MPCRCRGHARSRVALPTCVPLLAPGLAWGPPRPHSRPGRQPHARLAGEGRHARLTGRMRGGILQNPHAVSRSSRRPYGEARHTGRDLAQGGGGKGVACRGTAQEGEMKSHRPRIGRRRRRGHAMRPPVPHGACSLRRSGAGKMGEGPREGVCAALGPPWVAAPAAGNRGGARSEEGPGRGGRAGYAAACAMTHLRALLSIAVPLWTATRIARMRLP